MKLKVLSALLVSAFAGVATTASAGVIQASYKNFAAEVFGSDITMTVPTIGYSLALPLTGTAANPNNFVVTYTLTSGEWVTPPTATLVSVNNVDFIAAAAGVIDPTDPRKVSYQFTLNNGVTFPTASTIVLGTNAANALSADGTIDTVHTVLRTPADADKYCNPTTAEIGISIRLTNAAGVEFDSNFTNAPLDNDTPILQSSVAQRIDAISSATYVDPEASQVNVLIPALGRFFTDPADATDPSTTIINIGQVRISDRAALYDRAGDVFYSVFDADWTAAAAGDGGVSQNGMTVRISGRFVSTGDVYASTTADCAPGFGADTYNADRSEATLTLTAAELDPLAATGASGTGRRSFFVCYSVPVANAAVIPVSQFAVAGGSMPKDAGTSEITAQVCPGNIYNLTANGVRVDVRNYIPAIVEGPSGGWRNVVRIINTDEMQPSVDVVGTALLRDGTIGASAIIAPAMKPREVRYLSGTQIDAILNAAATAAAPTFGADDIPANARLRITAPSSSIRVQNYHFNPATGNYLEASSAQGDDGVINAAAPTVADVIRARADGQNK